MNITYYKPDPLLQKYIYKYWAFESDPFTELPIALPAVATEMIIHYRTPFNFCNKEKGIDKSTGSNFIFGLRDFPYKLKTIGNTGFISIRFREGALSHFCSVPQNEIAGSFPTIRDLWGKKGVKFENDIQNAQTNPGRAKVIDSYLLNFFTQYSGNDKWLEYSVDNVCKGANLNSISQKLNISYRHFNRKFTYHIGVNPKTFQKISVFDSVLRNLMISKSTDYLNFALDAGYFDQSHFIKDFKKFVNKIPSSYLTSKNFMSHFYNTKDLI
ncbi:MAG: AraC family transcriptional regulator [Deltaproteobacteria bacterium]|nr:AraC family transcriptional regulator [Deltaproteobacteria bacterium]